MGLCFGFLLFLLFVGVYWVMDLFFWVVLVVFNVFFNLFNLLFVLLLDGGYIFKSVSFLMNSKMGVIFCVFVIFGGIVLSYSLGLILFGFLFLMGVLDIVFEWC